MPGATPYRKNDKAKPKKRKPTWKPGTKVPAPTFPSAIVYGTLVPIAGPHFAGATYEPAKDHVRLTKNLQRVYDLMAGGEWWTIPELAQYLEPGGPMAQTGIGARLRDLRQPKFGGHTVETRRRGGSGGLWEYRLVL